jgi:RNA polymerase sigma factor (sigma-70 family)
MRAAELYNFDMQHKANFVTYSFYWVNQKINRFMRIRNTNEETSLNTPIGEDGDTELIDFIEGVDYSFENVEDKLYNQQLRKELEEVMNQNNTLREREILKLRYGWDNNICMPLIDISELFNVTPERVRQIEVRSLRKLRCSTYIRKIVSKRQLAARTTFYTGGSDPVAKSVIARLTTTNRLTTYDRAIENDKYTNRFEDPFYKWHNSLLEEKDVMIRNRNPEDKDKIKKINDTLTMIDNALNEMFIHTKDKEAWVILNGRLNGMTERLVQKVTSPYINYWATERKAIDYIKSYLCDRNVTCMV